ncbi:hypothetical protein CVT24_001280 [Panaeolus cyanescens]|uniref:FAD/NAD(P)-binding domain-containing protein n=1 Tax=Panaeolus cyanescens TaxID=181874 RepID=A0A409YZ53_9AGAR|nr:hypothetical protein CVT24_001280 [Panaeolus cyanescens]
MDKKADTRLTVVIVGGGAAGVQVAHDLAPKLQPKHHRLVLVTASQKYTYLPATLRLIASPDTSFDTARFPYDNVFGSFPGEVKVGVVTSIEQSRGTTEKRGMIVIDGKDNLLYDVAILATGSVWKSHLNFPASDEEFEKHVHTWRNRIQDAKNVVIAGGGAVGIELAGEIKDVYEDKNIVVVQANPLLLGDIYPDKFRKDIEARLRSRGVKLYLNDMIEGEPDNELTIKTTAGVKLDCDLLISARGGQPNTKAFKFLRPFPLTDRGYVKVKPTLQVEGHPNIFALGDIIEWPEAKQIIKILYGHTDIVVANVLSFLRGKQPKRYYKGCMDVLSVSIGKGGGGTYFGGNALLDTFSCHGLCLGDACTRIIKAKDLNVPTARKSVGMP